MKTFSTYSVNELKVVYRVLHGQIMDHLELLDSEFFSDLQTYLQNEARADGVDVGHHAAWDRWLGETSVSSEGRVLATLN